ncbi:MAG: siroheme synthase [Proteobacteria bacterium]|nr:siroheme synthase [Pseudomonadota bacterium]
MLPIVLDPARIEVALVGREARALRRLALLEDSGAADLRVFSDRPSPALAAAAGQRLQRRLPTAEDLAGCAVVYVADLPFTDSVAVRRAAKSAGALVNVEDERALCDFHSPAVVQRGDLVLAVSTGGRSPALARHVRERLEAVFPDDWSERLDRIAALRGDLYRAGHRAPDVARASRELIATLAPVE